MIVVTTGKKYIDIDAYASCIAYAKLLNLKGINAKAVSKANLNESITTSIKELDEKLDNYIPKDEDKYIIIDISKKEEFDTFVKEENIIEIIDHHQGFKEYWEKKLRRTSKYL